MSQQPHLILLNMAELVGIVPEVILEVVDNFFKPFVILK
jgi:hypothetical protein